MREKRKKKQTTLKQRRANLRSAQERRRLKKLAADGRLANGVELPQGAVAADLSQQAPNNSYSPPLFYQAIEFVCVECGVREVWSAKNQKWYFEVIKAPIYGLPKRCRECRRRLRHYKVEQQKHMVARREMKRKPAQPD
jgi:hypothetical protein